MAGSTESSDGVTGIRPGWGVLRYQLLKALWIAAVASNLGTWMHEVGAAWLAPVVVSEPEPEEGGVSNWFRRAEHVYRVKRLRLVDQEPVVIVTSYLPENIFPGLDNQDLEGQSLSTTSSSKYMVESFRCLRKSLAPVNAGHEEAQILQTAVGFALLLIKETAVDIGETPLEYAVSLLRSDRYAASVVSVRKT